MPDSTNERFELPITVKESDIDSMGHVNNVVYVRWVQDAAVAHWRALATPDQQKRWKWVVVRHEIDYKRAVGPGEEVVAQTWVGNASEMTFERHTEIIRVKDHKILAVARTLWCPVNATTFKPSRVDPDVRSRFSKEGHLTTDNKEQA